MASRPNYKPSDHTRLFWVNEGVKRGVGVFCKGWKWGDKTELQNQAKKLRSINIAAYVRKFQHRATVTHLLFVEDDLSTDQIHKVIEITYEGV